MGKTRKVPLRQCVGCREMKSKQQLLRIVRISENEIRTDVTGKLNGRGAYLCRNADCFDKAVRSRSLQRSLGAAITPEMLEQIGRDLEREIRNFETG